MSVTAASLIVRVADGVRVDAGVTGSVPAEGVRWVLAQPPPSKTASVGAASRVRRLRRELRWPNMITTVGTDCLIKEHPWSVSARRRPAVGGLWLYFLVTSSLTWRAGGKKGPQP